MTASALGLYVAFIFFGFGWRSWIQYRRTGSTGFRGFHGRPGSVDWFAGIGFAIALGAGLAAPALQLVGLVDPIAIFHSSRLQIAGLVVAVIGIVTTVYAQQQMGESWRIGVDSSEITLLVDRGIFGVVRNPVFSAILIFAAGITLAVPNSLAFTAFASLFVTIELQVRRIEEPYLEQVHGDAYVQYRKTVGRFVPRLGH